MERGRLLAATLVSAKQVADAARSRMPLAPALVEAGLDEFRALFPAALCYTKIVPVDEVVTLTLHHREDDALRRLMLSDREAEELEQLWAELRFVSQDALTLVDAFEQLWQYATQDADPKVFEPLREPIKERAARFREEQAKAEPSHLSAAIEFARRAYRRPLTGAEQASLLIVFNGGDGFLGRIVLGPLRGRAVDLPDALAGTVHNPSIQGALSRLSVGTWLAWTADPTP